MKIGIVAERFLADKTGEVAVGGVQVWLSELVKVIRSLGHEAILVQKYKEDFEVRLEDVKVRGIRYGTEAGFGNFFTLDCRYNVRAHRVLDSEKAECIIYGNSLAAFPIYRPGNIFLQHGIYWDGSHGFSWRRVLRNVVKRIARPTTTTANHDLKLYRKSRLTISVDTNFINYARAMLRGKFDPSRIIYIPNFAEIPENDNWKKKWKDPKEIVFLFPRRFTPYRGTLLWADAAGELLKTTAETRFVFDGEGLYGPELQRRFADNPRVEIRPVNPKDMPAEYEAAHVVVVPTVFSEGTSLSCIEGMAYGCVPLVTDVGGLANLVFPDYNGYVVRPDVDELLSASRAITADIPKARTMAENSHEIARSSFGLTRWRERMKEALLRVL